MVLSQLKEAANEAKASMTVDTDEIWRKYGLSPDVLAERLGMSPSNSTIATVIKLNATMQAVKEDLGNLAHSELCLSPTAQWMHFIVLVVCGVVDHWLLQESQFSHWRMHSMRSKEWERRMTLRRMPKKWKHLPGAELHGRLS